MDIHGSLRQIPSLASVPEVEVAILATVATRRRLARGEVLFSEGEAPAGFHLVEAGWLKGVRTAHDGRELVQTVFGLHDLIGTCPGPRTVYPYDCTVRAMTQASVLSACGLAVTNVLRQCPALLDVVQDGFYTGKRRCVELTVDLALQDIDRRLAQLLLRLARRYPTVDAEGRMEVPSAMSQREMAAAIGTAREVVTRHVASLVGRGILMRKGRRILLAKPGELSALVETL
ncbi:MAG: Crp/Fnr family transcriptional regulator [Candidatus Riflebacteria bacterium]|nr:Crp/Fnr family transcriptional regulator [Candidatus Riflebacteria bacterium]